MITQTCAYEGNLEKMKKLLDQGIDINLKTHTGKSPIHIAVSQNDMKMVEYLLSLEEIDLHSIDNEGNSPLFYACYNGNEDIAEKLISKHALFETNQNRLAFTLCQKALVNDLVSLKLFDHAGANLESSDYDKRTCGHIAAAENHEPILQYLSKETKFDFDLKDRWGLSVIDEIKDEGLRQIIRQQFQSNERNK